MSYSLSCSVCLEVSIIKYIFLKKKEQLTIDAGLSSFAFSFWKLYCMLPSTVLTFPFLVFIKYKPTNQQKKPLSIICQQSTNQFLPPRVSFFLLPSPPPNKKYFKCFCWPFPASSTPTFCQGNPALSVVG